jgi:hypothetical protein
MVEKISQLIEELIACAARRKEAEILLDYAEDADYDPAFLKLEVCDRELLETQEELKTAIARIAAIAMFSGNDYP